MTTYRVGQILYVILSKKTQIYPMQVVEEVTKKTLEGSVTSYMVRGGPNTSEVLSIDQIEGEIFDSATKVQKTLLERATNGITSLVEAAVTKAQEWYPTGFEQPSDDELAALKKSPVPGQIPSVAAPVANRNSQQQPKKPGKKLQPPPEIAELAAELQADNEKLEVEMPDGTKVRVNSIKVPDAMQG